MPSDRFHLQLWDKDLKLQTDWLPSAFDIVEGQELNVSHTLDFKYPTSDSRAASLTFRKVVRLLDAEDAIHVTGITTIDSVADRQVSVAAVGALAVGDFVLIFDSPSLPTKSFVAQITAISGLQLTLSRMDFTPTAGTAETGAIYADIDGLPYSTIIGQTYADLLAGGGAGPTSTGSPLIKWTGKTFRIWETSEEKDEDGLSIRSVNCNHISYDLNDRKFIKDARTDIAFALASVQTVTDSLLNPSKIIDEVVKSEPQNQTDFTNGWIKGTVDTFLTDQTRTEVHEDKAALDLNTTASTSGGSLSDDTYYFAVAALIGGVEYPVGLPDSAVVSGGGGSGSIRLGWRRPGSFDAESQVVTTGTVVAGSYANTEANADDYFQLTPTGAAPIDMYLKIDTGGSVPTQVVVDARYEYAGAAGNVVHVYAYDHTSLVWDVLTDGTTSFDKNTVDEAVTLDLETTHRNPTTNEVWIRFLSDDNTATRDLYIDEVSVLSSVTQPTEYRVYGYAQNAYTAYHAVTAPTTTWTFTATGDLDVTATPTYFCVTNSRTVTGVGTSFLSIARTGTRLYTNTLGNLIGIVQQVVSDTEITLTAVPRFSLGTCVFETDPDKREITFDTEVSLRGAILQIATIWEDETQAVHITFLEDKSIDIAHVPIPNTNDPTGDVEIRVGKNLQSSSRKREVDGFGNSVYPTGATSNWVNAQTGQAFEIAENPHLIPYHRNTKHAFLLNTRTDIKHLRWGDPIIVMHDPVRAKVNRFLSEDELVIDVNTDTPTGVTVNPTVGGSLAAGTYRFRVSAIMAGGETPASAQVQGVASGSSLSFTVQWNAVTGATGYRIYGIGNGVTTHYHTHTATTAPVESWLFQNGTSVDGDGNVSVTTVSTLATYMDARGQAKDFEGDSYVNGIVLVKAADTATGALASSTTGVGQFRAIEQIVLQSALSTSHLFYLKTTTPWDVTPGASYELLLSKSHHSFETTIKGFGLIERTQPTGSPNTITAFNVDDEGRATLVDENIGYGTSTGSFKSSWDIFHGHYVNGILQLRDARDAATTTTSDRTKYTGQQHEILGNSRGNRQDGALAALRHTMKFSPSSVPDDAGAKGAVRYEMMAPPQLVKDFRSTEYDITTTITAAGGGTAAGVPAGLRVNIKGGAVYTSGTDAGHHTVSTSGQELYIKDDVPGSSTGSFLDIKPGMEIWCDAGAGEVFTGIVAFAENGTKQVHYIETIKNVATMQTAETFSVRRRSPNFGHDATTVAGASGDTGNHFSFFPHRHESGSVNTSTILYGFAYIADAERTDSGGDVDDWGSGANGSTKEGIGHALRISEDLLYGASQTLDPNELFLEWSGAASTTHTAINIKWISFVRTNTFLWVSTEQADWNYTAGDYVLPLLAETGGPLTIGKAIAHSSRIVGLDSIASADAFDYGGFTKRAIPITSGDGVNFQADDRIFVGARVVDSAIQFGLRRGDQRQGQVVEVASIFVGADATPTRPFDLLILKNDLDLIPQPGDRVEKLTVQDSTSITSYGRIERQEQASEITNPNELYRRSRTALRLHKDPFPRYELSVLDWYFHNPSGRNEFDKITLGQTVRVVDADFSVDASNFKVVKVERDYETPLASKITLDHHIRTLVRGFTMSTERRLRQQEVQMRTLQHQMDAPVCMYFNTQTRRCNKARAPNIFCNSRDSNRDGRLRADKSRMGKHDCRSFSPIDVTMLRRFHRFGTTTFTIEGAFSPTGKTVTDPHPEVQLPVISNSKPSDPEFTVDEDIPKPIAVVIDAWYDDDYGVPVYVGHQDLTATIVVDDDGGVEEPDEMFRTGVKVKVEAGANLVSGKDVNGTVLVFVPGPPP